MRTERGFDRLVNFSDAVVAIAITLLILPLVELAGEVSGEVSVADVLTDNDFQFGSFVLSFYVIGTLWRGHHRLFEYVGDYDRVVMRLNMIWLLTIVFVPFATQMLGEAGSDRLAKALYVGTIFVSSLCLTGLEWWVRRHPELRVSLAQAATHAPATDDHDPIDGRIWVLPATLLVVGVIATAVPAVGLWAMLLLLLVGPARRIGRKSARAAPAS